MLLEDVDEFLKPSTKMREATNCQRFDNSNNGKSTVSESHVEAMSNSEIGCNRVLYKSKTCGCIYDGNHKSHNLKESSYEHQSSRSRSENGNVQNEPVDVNENLQFPGGWSSSGAAWSCPRICISSMDENRPLVTVDNDSVVCNASESEDEEPCPVIRLSLCKPRHWKWKLTTSASSPAIILPAIQLLDEQGDLLLDTRKGPQYHAKHRRKRVDSNGNDDFESTEDVSRILQKRTSERLNSYTEKRRVDRMNNEATWDDLLILQKDEMGNLLIDDRSEIPEEEDQENAEVNRGNRIRHLDRLSPRTMRPENPFALDLEDQSSTENLAVKSIKGFRTKSLSRSFNKKKSHLRRKLEKRNNCENSSSSGDSSPKMCRRRIKPRNRTATTTPGKKGELMLCMMTIGYYYDTMSTVSQILFLNKIKMLNH
ncbi:hypothetical protein C0J52_12065 [Blattella germanica]|nr:hypothetical protein C0J52_12065 [Blattella germanica]